MPAISPGGEAVIIEVHNHEVEGGDDCRAHDDGHKKHLGHLPLYGPEQIAVRRPQVPQVVVHPCVGEGDGHAPGKGNDDDRREADQGDKDEQHQKHRHGGDEVVLIQHPELGHVEPVVAEPEVSRSSRSITGKPWAAICARS